MKLLTPLRLCLSAAVLLLSSVHALNAEDDAQDALPAGYVDEAVTDVNGTPTGLALTPDGRLLITRQEGNIRIYKNGALVPTAALDLAASGTVCSAFERGIESVAVDPNFAANNRIYVYYTYAGSDNTCTSSSDEINRVARYTLNGDVAQSPTVILNNIDSPCGNHNGGSVNFGADGLLYISTGDGGCNSDTAQNRNLLNGKILRINPDGSIPASNPYVNTAGSVACAASAADPSGGICREIFAYGLRNPFKIAFKHNTNVFHINDVGQNAWEEISVGASGANYGWNNREGFCVAGSTSNCGAPPAGMTNPIYAYGHAEGLCSITGGAFSTNVWTGDYADAYYFADWCDNVIYRLVPGSGGSYTRSLFHTSPDGGGVSALLFDPASKSLYYAQNGGAVRRIRYTGASNRAPVAVASVSINYGALPFTAEFSSGGSSDPDGDALSYGWTFGDGDAPASEANPSHTYTLFGTFTATLTVTDSKGTPSAPATVTVFPGNTPPDVAITSPDPSFRFAVGQSVTLTATASDAEDNTQPALSWRVLLWHVPQALTVTAHTHPFFSGTDRSVTIPSMPAPEDLDAAPLSYLEIRVTATDLNGLTRTVTQTLSPNRVPVTLASQPDGLILTANGASFATTRQITGWQGMTLTLSAPGIQHPNARDWLLFASWSDSGARSHDVLVPAEALTVTAVYSAFQPELAFLPTVRRR